MKKKKIRNNKPVELRTPCCDMRLIGVEYDKVGNQTGYVIYIDRTQQIQSISEDALKKVIKQCKFANAVVENNELKCTDCDISELHKFRSTGKSLEVLDSNKIYVLGEITDNENRNLIIGYRVLINSIIVIDLEKEKLTKKIKAKDSQLKLVNSVLENDELKIKNDIKIDKIIKIKG